jgi:integrase
MLNDDITAYVKLRRAAGFKFESEARVLKNFIVFAEAQGDTLVRVATVLEWAATTPSLKQRRKRLLMVRRFALAVKAEDPNHEVPAADALGHTKRERPPPYIYTAKEITSLMHAAAHMQTSNPIKPTMYATLFGLLAATGLRISEALALRCDDIIEDGLIVRMTKFKKSRLVPLHETTRRALDSYLSVRKQHNALNAFLFISISGRVLPYQTVLDTFRRLASSIGLREAHSPQGPRIHDLRHTFAVRSLEQCGCDRDEVARHMVALSTYMGHACVTDTYWYLQATPVLMKQIAEVAERQQQGGAT